MEVLEELEWAKEDAKAEAEKSGPKSATWCFSVQRDVHVLVSSRSKSSESAAPSPRWGKKVMPKPEGMENDCFVVRCNLISNHHYLSCRKELVQWMGLRNQINS